MMMMILVVSGLCQPEFSWCDDISHGVEAYMFKGMYNVLILLSMFNILISFIFFWYAQSNFNIKRRRLKIYETTSSIEVKLNTNKKRYHSCYDKISCTCNI